MPDETVDMPEWLAALRDPILGDVRLSPNKILAPEHIPDVLKAFRPQHPPSRRWIVNTIDQMAIKLCFSSHNKAPQIFSATNV